MSANPTPELPEVSTLLPHSGAMVLLDRVLAADEDSLCAEVRIGPRSVFYDSAAGGVGAWVGIEYMAQAIAAHAGWLARRDGLPVRIGFLLGSRRYEAGVPLFERGAVLAVHALRVLRGENGLGAFECRIEAGGAVLATATVTVFQPDNVNQFLNDGNAV